MPLRMPVFPLCRVPKNRHDLGVIDVCELTTLMPEEEPESPAEGRSQWKRSFPNVDERTEDAPRGERRE